MNSLSTGSKTVSHAGSSPRLGGSSEISNTVISSTLASFQFTPGSESSASTTFTIPASTECWTLYVVLDYTTQYEKMYSGLLLSLAATSSSGASTRSAGFDITPPTGGTINAPPTSPTGATTQGYAALRFPNQATDVVKAESWTVTLSTGSDQTFPFTNLSLITGTLVTSQLVLPNTLYTESFTLPLKFVLVATEDQLADRVLKLYDTLTEAIRKMKTAIFRSVNGTYRLNIDIIPSIKGTTVEKVESNATYSFDVTDPTTLNFINNYISPTYITVFVMTKVTLPVTAGGQKVPGLSMVTGPQDPTVKSPWGKVLISGLSTISVSGALIPMGLAKRFTHEIGHYLGLVHENACMGNTKTKGDNNATVCTNTLFGLPGGIDRTLIDGNLMFTSQQNDDTGGALQAFQTFILRRNPIIVHKVRSSTTPLTPVTSIYLVVSTGTVFHSTYDWFIGDGAGTNNKVFLRLNFQGLKQSYSYPNNGWLTLASGNGADDFKAATSRYFTFAVSANAGVYYQELVGFTIYKASDPYPVFYDIAGVPRATYNDDEWLIQGLVLKVNDTLVYNHPTTVNLWLTDDASKEGIAYKDFDIDQIPPPLKSPSHHIANIANTANLTLYAPPPFIASSTQLTFGSGLSTVTIPTWSSLVISGPGITIEAWILCQVSSLAYIQIIALGGNLNNGIYLRLNNGNYEIGTAVSGQIHSATASIPSTDLNAWVHLTGTYDGATMSLYRNGVAMSQISAPGIYPASITGNLNIGWDGNSNSYFNGSIRNLGLWKAARSTTQILEDMSGIDPEDPAIAGYWALDEEEGTIAFDGSFPSTGVNPGSITNPVWFAPPNTEFAGAVAILGKSLSSPVYLSLPATSKIQSGLKAGSVTVMGWVRISSKGWNTGQVIFFGTDTFSLGICDYYTYYFGYNDLSLAVQIPVPGGDLDQWVHLAGQYDSSNSTWSLWRNGFCIGTTNGKGIVSTDPTWYIGGGPKIPNSSYTVEYQRVWLFGSAISKINPTNATNLRTQYLPYIYNETLPSTVSSDNLLAFWALDEGAGSNIYDLSGIAPLSETVFTDSNILRGTVPFTPNYRFVDMGTTISSVLKSITDASKTNIYTVFVGAGNFKEQVAVPSWITLVGYGNANTNIIIGAQTSFPYGGLSPSSNTMIRQIQIIVNLFPEAGIPIALPIEVTGATNVALDWVTAQVNVTGTVTNGSIYALALNATRSGPPASVAAVNCTFGAQTAPSGTRVNLIQVNNSSSLTMVSSIATYSNTVTGQNVVSATNNSTCTLQQCVLAADPSNICLTTDKTSIMTVQDCQITGSTQGNITTLPPNPPPPNRF